MPKMIQLRNVPDELHRKLKVRAAEAGMTLSDYLIAELREVAARPTPAEMEYRLRHLPPARVKESAAEVVRAGRGEP